MNPRSVAGSFECSITSEDYALAVRIGSCRQSSRRTLTEPELDLAFLFFTREELAAGDSPLRQFFEDCPGIADAELVLMMEPTDNTIQVGCLAQAGVDAGG